MSAMRGLREQTSAGAGKQAISGTRLRAAKHLKFFHGHDDALIAVEFETLPTSSALHPVYRELSKHHVCVADTSARLTAHSMYQRFELCEPSGSPLLGDRRREVEGLFLEILASLNDESDETLELDE